MEPVQETKKTDADMLQEIEETDAENWRDRITELLPKITNINYLKSAYGFIKRLSE